MGRQFKEGLDYFELDCQLDDKVKLIQAEFGLKGFAIVVMLFQRIYGGHGYYCEWDEDRLLLFTSEAGLDCGSKNTVRDIVSACIKRGLFSEDLFTKYEILTSSGIQRRYLNAVSRRENVKLKKEYLLINVDQKFISADINAISADINVKNVSRNTQRRVEKSREEKRRVEKSRVEESKEGSSADAPPAPRLPTASQLIEERSFDPELEKALKLWVKYKTELHKGYKETGLKSLLTQAGNKASAYGTEAVVSLINECMSNGYQGIIWDKLGRQKQTARPDQQSQMQNRFSGVERWIRNNSEP